MIQPASEIGNHIDKLPNYSWNSNSQLIFDTEVSNLLKIVMWLWLWHPHAIGEDQFNNQFWYDHQWQERQALSYLLAVIVSPY